MPKEMSKGRENCKYLWTYKGLDDWCKKQKEELRRAGFEVGTGGVTKLLHEKILVPNNVSLTKLIRPRQRLRIK